MHKNNIEVGDRNRQKKIRKWEEGAILIGANTLNSSEGRLHQATDRAFWAGAFSDAAWRIYGEQRGFSLTAERRTCKRNAAGYSS